MASLKKGKWTMKKYVLNGLIKCKEYCFSRDFDEGYMFYNERGENLVVCYDTYQQCYEDFETKNNLNLKYGEELVISENGIEIIIEDVDDDFESGNICSFHIYTFDKKGENIKTYKITVCNEHNGYYFHSVGLAENDELIWEDAV